jgi:hypothetical protein
MLRSYLAIFVFLILNLHTGKAQDCLSGGNCSTYLAIGDSCKTTPRLEYTKCICNHSDFGSAVQICYACIQTLGNETLTNLLGEDLNLCVSKETTITTTPTNIETLTIIGVTTPPVTATRSPTGAVSTAIVSKSDGSSLKAIFWFYFAVFCVTAVGLNRWCGCG